MSHRLKLCQYERSSHPIIVSACSQCSEGSLWVFTDTFISKRVVCFFLCVYVFVCIHVGKCVEDRRQPLGPFLIATCPVFLRQVSPWPGSSVSWYCLLPSAGVTSLCRVFLFQVGLEGGTQVLMLAQAFDCLS